jgi:monoamine oxidase
MNGGRSPLYWALRRILRQSAQEGAGKKERFSAGRHALHRREFLAASLGAAALGTTRLGAWQGASPRVVIVGAGLAGLNAGLTLKDAKVNATIYEASPRVGGRVLTARNLLGEGLTTELGAEFIDTSHQTMLGLAQRFRLILNDITAPDERGLLEADWLFDGKRQSVDDIVAQFRPLTAQMIKDSEATGPRRAQLDRLSMAQYLEQIGARGWIRSLLEVAYIAEYGADAADQSALNLIETIGADLKNGFKVYGDSDERYRILGGNDQVPKALYGELKDQVQFGHRLESLTSDARGSYRLSFRKGVQSVEVTADAVVLAVPFTMLREVELRIPLSGAKRRAIRELGYGTNVKLLAGYTRPVWRDLRSAGNGFTDAEWQTCWDNSRGQKKPVAGMTFFLGGKAGAAAGSLDVKAFLDRSIRSLDPIYTGLSGAFTGKQSRMFWPGEPFVKASYSMYRPGQWTALKGKEFEPAGNVYFAGEHCSTENQGFMEGAAETGRMVAEAILRRGRLRRTG